MQDDTLAVPSGTSGHQEQVLDLQRCQLPIEDGQGSQDSSLQPWTAEARPEIQAVTALPWQLRQ